MNFGRIRSLWFLHSVIFLSLLSRNVNAQGEGTCTLGGVTCSCDGGTVDCSGKSLTVIPNIVDTQRQLNVNYINLRDNQIKEISISDLEGYSNMKTLDLSLNAISRIDAGAFASLASLETLRLNGNALGRLGQHHFRGLAKLRYLYLDNNQQLTIDPCLFLEVPSLSVMSLRTTMVDLSADLVVAPVRCPTSDGEPVFPYTGQLVSLSIGYEGTTSDASHLGRFANLSALTINAFTAQSFGSSDLSTLRQLTRLTLEEVNVFPKGFLSSASLTTLALTNSRFQCLPAGAFMNLPSLQILQMQHNDLRWVDRDAMRGAGNLMRITLNSNQLSTLPSGVFDTVGNSTYFPNLVITTNRWECDCRSEWLREFLLTDPRVGMGNFHISCEQPTKFSGKSLTSVNIGPCASEEDDGDEDDHGDICRSTPRVTTESSGLVTDLAPTDGGLTDQQLIYYITGCITVGLVGVALFLVCVICRACQMGSRREGNDHPEAGSQRRARRKRYEGNREGHGNDGMDPGDGYSKPGQEEVEDDYSRPDDNSGAVYDVAPSRKELMAMKVATLPVNAPSEDDMRYVEGLDIGLPQRSSVHYVNRAPKLRVPPPVANRRR